SFAEFGSSPSGTRREIGGQPVADVFGNFLGRAVLCVAQAALAGEALLLAGNIVRDARKGLALRHRFYGRELGQGIDGVDAIIIDVGPCSVDIYNDLELRCVQSHVEAMGWRGPAGAAGKILNEFVAHADAD